MNKEQHTSTIVRTNINEQVYEFLQDKILTHKYVPGQRLDINRLKETLAVSATPIKDALHKLAGEGFVKLVPRRGIFVTIPSIREMKESFDVRLMIETYAISCALKRKIRRKEINLLKHSLRECAESIKKNDYSTFMEKDRDFHHLLVKTSNNHKLCEFYLQLNIHMHLARLYFARSFKRLRETQKEHEEILDALEKQDPDLTKACLAAHIMAVKRSIMREQGQKRHLLSPK